MFADLIIWGDLTTLLIFSIDTVNCEFSDSRSIVISDRDISPQVIGPEPPSSSLIVQNIQDCSAETLCPLIGCRLSAQLLVDE